MSSRKKKEGIFDPLILSEGIFFNICLLSQGIVLNTLLEYTNFYISKNIASYTFLLVFKIVKSFQYILRLIKIHRKAPVAEGL